MSLEIPLAAIPSQSLTVNVGGQVARITVRTIGASLYFTLDNVVTNRICRDRQRLLIDAGYRGFLGDFQFIDTKGAADPAYWGLGDRWRLIYGE